MEIPEYNPELIPRIRNTEYWPYAKFIPVLSDAALQMLKEKGAIEIKQDDGEEVIRIIVENGHYEIPKILTSKKTLSWLGFTQERVDLLWDTLVKASPPIITPSISDGGGWAFWHEIKLWLGDVIYATTKRTADTTDDEWNDKVLKRIGLSDYARLKSLRIRGREDYTLYTYIHQAKPQDLIPIVQRYVYYRWNMLTQMNKMILYHSSCYSYLSIYGPDGSNDCMKTLVKQLEMEPLDLDSMYGRRCTWIGVEWNAPPLPPGI